MDVCLLWVLSGRGLCDELITRPEESYRLWCVVVCDLETSWMRRLWPTAGCRAKNKQKRSIPLIEHSVVKCFVPTFKTALIFMLTYYRNTTSVHMLLLVPSLYLNPIEYHALLFHASAFLKKMTARISGIDRVCEAPLSSYIHWKLLQNLLLFIEISQQS